jgi:hypothetical protein
MPRCIPNLQTIYQVELFQLICIDILTLQKNTANSARSTIIIYTKFTCVFTITTLGTDMIFIKGVPVFQIFLAKASQLWPSIPTNNN